MNKYPKLKKQDEEHPFGLPWLDSCYQQTLLPSSPWWKVCDKINGSLVRKLPQFFVNEKQKQMLFSLLGPNYIRLHFESDEFKPAILVS